MQFLPFLADFGDETNTGFIDDRKMFSLFLEWSGNGVDAQEGS